MLWYNFECPHHTQHTVCHEPEASCRWSYCYPWCSRAPCTGGSEGAVDDNDDGYWSLDYGIRWSAWDGFLITRPLLRLQRNNLQQTIQYSSAVAYSNTAWDEYSQSDQSRGKPTLSVFFCFRLRIHLIHCVVQHLNKLSTRNGHTHYSGTRLPTDNTTLHM